MSVLFNGIIVMAFMPLMVIEVAAGGPGIFLVFFISSTAWAESFPV
jgi:hypothetical protein